MKKSLKKDSLRVDQTDDLNQLFFANTYWGSKNLLIYENFGRMINRYNPFKIFVKDNYKPESYANSNKLFNLKINWEYISIAVSNFIEDLYNYPANFITNQLKPSKTKQFFIGYLNSIKERAQEFIKKIEINWGFKKPITYSMASLLWCEEVYFPFMGFALVLSNALYVLLPLPSSESSSCLKTVKNVFNYFNTVIMPEYNAISRSIRADHKDTVGVVWSYLIIVLRTFTVWQNSDGYRPDRQWFWKAFDVFR